MTEPNQSTVPPPEAQQEIAQAAATTAAAGGSQQQVADAAQQAARAQGVDLTDAQAQQLAKALQGPVVEGLIAEFEKRGVFREEPEPVAPPPVAPEHPADPPAAPPASSSGPAHAAPPGDALPVKTTWAERHFG